MPASSREYPARPLVGIGVALFKPGTGAILLIRRGRPPAQGQWSLPGGAQRLGETAEQAARRELREETALECGPLRLAGHMDSIHKEEDGRIRFHYTILDFCALWHAGDARAGADAEAAAWVEPSALETFDLTPNLLAILAASRGILGL
jgi:ADP-ribose pyrophosphatase YjhB (NUDIX family)